jgi:hypothetical protein
MQSRSQPWRSFQWRWLLGLVACVALSTPSPALSEHDPPPVVLQRLRSEPYSYSYESRFKKGFDTVIRNAVQWKTIWQKTCADVCGADSMANVDFDKQVVLVSALGVRPTGGFSIILSAAHWTSQGLEIDVVEQFPSAQCVLTMADSSAIDVATIVRTDRPILFRRRRVETMC